LITCVDSKPVKDSRFIKRILKLFLHRVSTEMQREQTEQRFQKSYVRQNYILNRIDQVAIHTFKADGTITFWNKASEAFYGYSEKEAIGSKITDLIFPPEEAVAFLKLLASAKYHQDSLPTREYLYKRKDGSFIWALSSIAIITCDNENREFFCFDINITKRKEASEALEETRAILQVAMDKSHAGIAIADAPDGRLRYVNKAGLLIMGKSSQEEIQARDINQYAETWNLLDIQTKKPLKRHQIPLARAILYGEAFTGEYMIRRSENDDVVVWFNATPIYDDDKNVKAGLVIFFDVTEQKKIEKESKRLEDQLNHAQKMEAIGRLAGGVAHDFNNMLGVILGHTDLIMSQVEPSEMIYDDLNQIKSAAKRSANLTGQLLTYARKQVIQPKVIDLNESVAKMIGMLQRLIGEQITLKFDPAKDLWPILMDPSQVDQIVTNLCVNARDAIADYGEIMIETKNLRVKERSKNILPQGIITDCVLLSIRDNGSGMDEKTMNNLFEPFYTTKSIGKGTGLGLATVYGIINQNKGAISVESEPNTGTTFNIFLPRQISFEKESIIVIEESVSSQGSETILVVEDEQAMLDMTKSMLTRLGYNTLSSHSPHDAIRVAKDYQKPIHILMTDVVMPEMNGYDLSKKIVEIHPNIAVLFMSGYSADVLKSQKDFQGECFMLQKPFSIKDMKAKICETLEASLQKPKN
ncbi:MAG: PAS domain S-box protein, partial [Verrucomicrobiota bacterium]